jgi:putative transposase
MHSALRKRVLVRLKRNPKPSAAIVDSQSIKTTGVGGEGRGYDGGKKVKGILSATYWWTRRDWCSKLGSTARGLWTLRWHQAPAGALLIRSPPASLSVVARGAGYNGQDKGADWVQKVLGWTAEIVGHPQKPVPDELMSKWVRELTKERECRSIGRECKNRRILEPSCRSGG